MTQVTFVHVPSASHIQSEPSSDPRRRTQMNGPSAVSLCLVTRCRGKVDTDRVGIHTLAADGVTWLWYTQGTNIRSWRVD